MFKFILGISILFIGLGYYLANTSYTPISKQIDVKTMQIKKVDPLIKSWSLCSGNCTNYSSNSSYGSSSYGGK